MFFKNFHLLAVLLYAFVNIANCKPKHEEQNLTVNTLTGIFTGLIDAKYPNTRQFRAIPFSEPPVSSRRWLPPMKLSKSTAHHYPRNFPPSCPQFVSSGPTFWNQYISKGALIYNGNQNSISGLVAQTTSEDCLYMAIWTPSSAKSSSKLPVLFFMTGGGFQTGGIDVGWQIPAEWVQRSQKHIVVTINYRLNIFGHPNARGLEDQNLAFLDQRMALEWVRDNIAAFGGDSSRIMQWGQSAGSISTDVHAYAYATDPIANSYMLHSASIKTMSALGLMSPDPTHSNFTFVANHFGCRFAHDSAAELDCMRQVPFAMIENFIGQYSDNGTLPAITFNPVVDEKLVFSDYPARAAAGRFARKPVIVGHTANEAASLVPWPINNVTEGPYEPTVISTDLVAWVCPAKNITDVRSSFGIPIYRYQYAGRWPNLNPLTWLGAWHSSDIPMIFGTHELLQVGNSTELQIKTSHAMQDHIVAFAKDPINGPASFGWNRAATGGQVAQFGANWTAVQYVHHEVVDGACDGLSTYDQYP
ncbi:unnamed protein product [Aureobasidium pullulans]|nr:unnamed protein product [Aureobasidium pullulans]